MKIGIVMPLAEQRGGAELMLLHLLRANLKGAKIDYRIAFLEDGPMVHEVKELGYPVWVFPSGHLRELMHYTRTVMAIRRWTQDQQLTAVMSWMWKAHLYAGPAAALAGVDAVWWQHGIPTSQWMDHLPTLLPCRAIFCCSKAAQYAQEKLWPNRTTLVIYPAVDTSHFDPSILPQPLEARRALGLPENGVIIGTVARLQHWKGIHVFLETTKLLADKNPEAYFVVVGGVHSQEADYAERIKMQIHAMNLSHRVMLAGYQSNTALWMQAMDVFVHAAIEPEPFGMVIIEAMALGKVVIASEAGGPLEIIQPHINGRLVKPGDALALAETIEDSLAKNETNAALGRAAIQKASQYRVESLDNSVAQSLCDVIRNRKNF